MVITMELRHKDKYVLLGLNVAYYRKRSGMTQEQLAASLNVDRTTISKIESAVSGVSLDLLFDMADLWNIPPERFFDFRNEP